MTTTDRALTLPTRLGDHARPAGGRAPRRRHAFAVCVLESVEEARADRVAVLTAVTGPLRCSEVEVRVAVGDEATGELLHDLDEAGVTEATLGPVVTAYSRLAGYHPSVTPALVVASCDALTGQARAAVWAC